MLRNHIHQACRGSKELVQDCFQQRPHVHLVHYRLEMDSERGEYFLKRGCIFTEDGAVELVEWLKDEVHKRPRRFRVDLFTREFARVGVEIDVAPESVGERVDVEFA
jgi:hypothetical protein